ncbi:hypothetical protein [Variovorax paradoxus]|uniref:Uncharacterized protein n=1 Tax=Variovorax paradoxus TaxID=34073 RepID=A0A0H2MLI4_VARPD|nr:hypothetical protein [Variovorax paradoxus]KLN57645.1 hypothetical protein VPARA_11580 [Variovorax paradoxus]
MSMLELGNHHTRRGEFSNPVRRAVVDHLKANGPASITQLNEIAKTVPGHSDDETCSGLRRHMHALAAAGHAHRVEVDGQRLWISGPQPIAEGAAGARQVMVMDGSVYMPSPGPAMRPGAMDFARHPSVLLGQRCAYRSGL